MSWIFLEDRVDQSELEYFEDAMDSKDWTLLLSKRYDQIHKLEERVQKYICESGALFKMQVEKDAKVDELKKDIEKLVEHVVEGENEMTKKDKTLCRLTAKVNRVIPKNDDLIDENRGLRHRLELKENNPQL